MNSEQGPSDERNEQPEWGTSKKSRFDTRTRVIAAVVVVIALLVGFQIISVVLRSEKSATQSYDNGVKTLHLDLGNASVELVSAAPGAPLEVHTDAKYWFRAPKLQQKVDDNGRLTVKQQCSGLRLGGCSVKYRIAVPQTIPVDGATGNGNITASGVRSDVDLATNNGDVKLADVYGKVALRSDNGNIDVRKAQSFSITAKTNNGNVELSFVASPVNADAESANGKATIHVPKGNDSYNVKAGTDNGKTTIDVKTDPSAERTLTVHSNNGDVEVSRS